MSQLKEMNFNFKMFSPLTTPLAMRGKEIKVKERVNYDSDASRTTREIRKEVNKINQNIVDSDSDSDGSLFKTQLFNDTRTSVAKSEEESDDPDKESSNKKQNSNSKASVSPKKNLTWANKLTHSSSLSLTPSANSGNSEKMDSADSSSSDDDSEDEAQEKANDKSRDCKLVTSPKQNSQLQNRSTTATNRKVVNIDSSSSSSESEDEAGVNVKSTESKGNDDPKQTKQKKSLTETNRQSDETHNLSLSSESENEASEKIEVGSSVSKEQSENRSTTETNKKSGNMEISSSESESEDGEPKEKEDNVTSPKGNSPHNRSTVEKEGLKTNNSTKTKHGSGSDSDSSSKSSVISMKDNTSVSLRVSQENTKESDESDTNERDQPKQSLRFKAPEEFEKVEPCSQDFLTEDYLRGKKLFLIRAPKQLEDCSFRKQKINLDGSSSSLIDKNSQKEYIVEAHGNASKEAKSLRSVILTKKKEEHILSFGLQVSGQIYMREKGQSLGEVQYNKQPHLNHVVLNTSRPPITPFGKKSPVHIPSYIDSPQKSHKRKKKVKKEVLELENSDSINDSEERHKKKKRTEKDVMELESVTGLIDSKEKHKKRKKVKEEVMEIDNTTALNESEERHKKRKKAKEDTMEIDNTTDLNESEERHKKRKKAKEGTIEIDNTTDLNEERHKKKKKAKEEAMEIDSTTDLNESEERHKKKKKKKDKKSVDGGYGSGLEELNKGHVSTEDINFTKLKTKKAKSKSNEEEFAVPKVKLESMETDRGYPEVRESKKKKKKKDKKQND